jgi:hypothetical protein
MWSPPLAGLPGAWVPMPVAINQDRALIAHVPVGSKEPDGSHVAHAQLYGVNIIEGWRLAQVAIAVREARSNAKNLGWLVEPDDRESVAVHNVSRAASREELSALWERLHPQGLWSEQVNTAAATRWTQLQEAMS